MKLSKFTSFLVAAVLFLFAAVKPASAQWHNMPQGQRNSAILNRAFSQNGSYTGVECKQWVQNVVYSASGGAVWLPLNYPSQYEWYYHPYVYRFGMPYPLGWCQPGQIIQMKWNGGPHTAIVSSVDGGGMWWVDCNWGPPNNYIVRCHYVPYWQFNSAVGYNYSVYEVR